MGCVFWDIDDGWLGLRNSLLTVHSSWSNPRQFAAVCTETIRCIRLELTTSQPETEEAVKDDEEQDVLNRLRPVKCL